jgi:hypothetical protein
MVVDGHRVGEQPVERDEGGDGGKQREETVIGDAGGDRQKPVLADLAVDAPEDVLPAFGRDLARRGRLASAAGLRLLGGAVVS